MQITVDPQRLAKQVASLLINDVAAIRRRHGVTMAQFAERVPARELWLLGLLLCAEVRECR